MLKPAGLTMAALLTLHVALGPISTDFYLPALPTLVTVFESDMQRVQLTLSVFLFGIAFAQLAHGPLSDRFGRRPVLIGGATLYMVASVACVFVTTIDALIIARFFQAIGVCAGAVIGRAVVRDVYGRDRAARVLAFMGSAMAIAPLIAPLIGGAMLIAWGWQSLFIALALLGFVLLVLTAGGLPETNPWKDPLATRVSSMVHNYSTLLKDKTYMGYTLVNAFCFSGLFAFISGAAFVLIEDLGVPENLFGFAFGTVVAGYISGTVLAGRLTMKVGIDRLILWGAVICVGAGLTGAVIAAFHLYTIAAVIVPMFFFLLGLGLIMPNSMAGAVGPYPKMAGAASALLGFTQMIFAAIAGMIVGTMHDGTQLPMMLVVAGSGLLGYVSYIGLSRNAEKL